MYILSKQEKSGEQGVSGWREDIKKTTLSISVFFHHSISYIHKSVSCKTMQNPLCFFRTVASFFFFFFKKRCF